MKISRRTFLDGIGGTTAALFSIHPAETEKRRATSGRAIDCALLDLNSECALPESLHGYQAALASALHHLPEDWTGNRDRCRLVIVPGLGNIGPTMANALWDSVNDGACLLLESGAGFLAPGEFSVHQKMLDRHFNLCVESPVDLWSEKPPDDTLVSDCGRYPWIKNDSQEIVPYVSYVWPHKAEVRDFSRAVPVSLQTGDVIGSVGALPVAVK